MLFFHINISGCPGSFTVPRHPRLNICEFHWWNEVSHDVARTGTATVFPHTIAMAAFDPELLEQVADAIFTAGCAKYNKSLEFGGRDICKNLTYRFPNINIFRDPRWRNGQETYGEGPFLTASLGVSYVKGLQSGGKYLKTAGCTKHFSAHSGRAAPPHL